MRRLLLISLVLLGACNAPAARTTHAPPSPSAAGPATTTPGAPSREVQFVVLEARGPHGKMGPEPEVQDAHDRVAIVGMDGVARARADFTPRTLPVVGNAAPVLQPEARVVGGRVFYIDGAGVVRELTRTGVKPVASFTLKSQQVISFSVSPDARQVEASRYTFPQVNPNASNPGNIFLTTSFRYELLAAAAGGDARTVRTVNGRDEVLKEPEVVSWDGSGVIATRESTFGTQNGTQGRRLWGQPVHLDAAGQPGPVLGGPDCSVLSISGDVLLCGDSAGNSVSVRRFDGAVIWAVSPSPQGNFYPYLALSPDHERVAFSGGVRSHDGSIVNLPSNFLPEGWLDNQTLIGITGENDQQEMAIVRLANPTKLDDLGFKGEFIGVLP